jgi:ATP-binding cassette, subfamily B, multidrug efflux pump
MGMGGPPPAKIQNAGKTLRQLLGRLRPELPLLAVVAVFGVGSVAFAVVGPKIIGNATNLIFDGVVGKMLPAGLTKAQAIALLQANGQGQIAQLLSGMDVKPGIGIDFTLLGQTLLLAIGVYFLASVLQWAQGYLLAGVAQRTVYGLRREVEAKLDRLPLKYFDSHPHGDVLSRVTNDVDNIATTLQQGLSQIVTSVLTVVGVLAIMVWISWLLALIALVTVPLSVVVTLLSGSSPPNGNGPARSTVTSRRCIPATRWCRSSAGARPRRRSSTATTTASMSPASGRSSCLGSSSRRSCSWPT